MSLGPDNLCRVATVRSDLIRAHAAPFILTWESK